jgi:hypothetical protein
MKTPVGVRYVGACEIVLGVFTAFVGLMYVVYGFYGLIHLVWARVLLSVWIAGLMFAISVACFYTASGLSRGLKWAWRASWVIGLLAAFPGAHMYYLSGRPSPGAHGEGGRADVFAALWLLPIVLGGVALLLSSTRRFISVAKETDRE